MNVKLIAQVPEEELRIIRALARSEKRTVNSLVRKAIDYYSSYLLSKEEKSLGPEKIS